ncbi:histidine phosphatase family protein [Metabacillus fastidiosus]|uniref:histidine phosphatase family protein n=1 Tax=Metabacillus fastidiosus TaxID=1458 RepID=UPI002DBA27FE|nr:histidine phosphatase family protein [Metabacillus fastidiosus]MEC2075720.1 histidine phosphatase family protein [Metabacillus fastidiosus]
MGDHLVITLIRHGKTEANERKQYLGWTDVSLSTLGRAELKSLLQLSYPAGQLYISSDLKRCRETFVEIYGEECNGNPKWRELSFGEWELKTYEELCSDPLYQSWLTDFYNVSPPEGESYSAFERRIIEAFHETIDRAIEEGKKEIVIMTHGGPIQLLMTKLVPNEKDFFNWKPGFAEGYKVITTLEKIKEGARCISYVEVPFKEKRNG